MSTDPRRDPNRGLFIRPLTWLIKGLMLQTQDIPQHLDPGLKATFDAFQEGWALATFAGVSATKTNVAAGNEDLLAQSATDTRLIYAAEISHTGGAAAASVVLQLQHVAGTTFASVSVLGGLIAVGDTVNIPAPVIVPPNHIIRWSWAALGAAESAAVTVYVATSPAGFKLH